MKIILTIMLLFSLPFSLYGDANYGKRFFKKKLSSVCPVDGATFAQKHTQDEWDELKEEGKLIQEWEKICPEAKNIFTAMKRKDKKNLFDFVWAYASDSGEVPTCSGF